MNQSDVSVQVRRLGGGFGGKGARSDLIGIRKVSKLFYICVGSFGKLKTIKSAAIGSKLTTKDSSLEVPLSHSQQIIGGRPGFKTKYTAHVTSDGILKMLDATLYIDCGSS